MSETVRWGYALLRGGAALPFLDVYSTTPLRGSPVLAEALAVEACKAFADVERGYWMLVLLDDGLKLGGTCDTINTVVAVRGLMQGYTRTVKVR